MRATLLTAALLTLLLAERAASQSLYHTYVSTHGWGTGKWVLTCTATAVFKYGGSKMYGAAATTAFYKCHDVAIKNTAPGEQTLLNYMLALVKCGLASAVPGVAIISSDIVTCVAKNVNEKIGTGGK